MLMTVEKKFLTSMFLSNKAIVQQSSIRIVHRSVSACAHTTYLYYLLLRASVLKWASGEGGGRGGGGRQNMQVPPQPINSHHATGRL